MKLINSIVSNPTQKKTERRNRKTKLKALHHSILVKAEFFMKHERIMFVQKKTFPINYSSMGFWGGNLCFVICKAKDGWRIEKKTKTNAHFSNENL